MTDLVLRSRPPLALLLAVIIAPSADAQVRDTVVAQRSTAEQTYFEFQVEKPVRQAPGSAAPRYPPDLKAAGVEGEVLVQFVVDTFGVPVLQSFRVLKASAPEFGESVKAALPAMKFVPAEVRGRKVRQLVQQPFAFAIAGGAIGAQSSPDSAQRSAQPSVTPRAQANVPSRPARPFCWQGRPLARCRTFALFELSTQSYWFGSKLDPAVTRPGFGRSRDDDGLASHIVGDLGAMVNVGSRTAVGGTLTAGSVQAGGKLLSLYGAVGRYRRWLTPSITADAGIGILRIPVGTVVRTERENVHRPAFAADVRLGFRDLLSATGRFMVASDGQGHTHRAVFVGAATGSKITTTIAGLLAAVGTYYIFFGPRGDKVNVQ